MSWREVKKRVVIVGGTHGNERNGLYLIKQFESVSYSNFSLETHVGNPRSVVENRRFLDTDLNRCFVMDDLEKLIHSPHYERNRAIVLNNLLGPKGSDSPTRADVIFDLHNTVANTGVLLLLHSNDVFAHQIAQHIVKHHPQVRIGEWTNREQPFLPTIGKSGMTVEVGPVVHGCLNAELFFETKNVLETALKFIENHNNFVSNNSDQVNIPRQDSALEVFQKLEKPVLYSVENGYLANMIHPDLQGKDFQELKDGDNILISTATGEPVKWSNPYDHPCYPYFINEAAYYDSGIAFVLARKKTISFPSSFVE